MKAKIYPLVAGLALLTSCQQYPMGHSKAQWEALSPQQQTEFQAQQRVMDEQRRIENERLRQAEEARLAQERAIAAERERIERERLRAFYRHARYGDVITVTIQGGTVDYGGTGREYEPFAFDLIRGERKLVEIAQKGRANNRISVPMRLSEDGNTFFMDAEHARDRIALIKQGWDRGRTYPGVEVTDHSSVSRARGITIKIVLKDLPGAPRKPEERRLPDLDPAKKQPPPRR